MFCPKCGAENPDANKFCRACRESLLVVAQAMKKRLPMMIVSHLDAALERLSERFRRNSVLFLFLGVWMLVSVVLRFNRRLPGDPAFYSWDVGITLLSFFTSAWEYMAYKRSLKLGERWAAGALELESGTGSADHSLGSQTADSSTPPPFSRAGAGSTYPFLPSVWSAGTSITQTLPRVWRGFANNSCGSKTQ